MRRLLLCLLLVTGCVHRMSTYLDSWVGRNVDEVITQWGAPRREAALSDGGRVLTWERVLVNEANESSLCVRSFTVGTDNRITKWSATGCPALTRN